MSEDYTQKYLKYKNKYLKLKAEFLNKNKQFGGGNNSDDIDQLTATPTQTEVYGRKLVNMKLVGGDMAPNKEVSELTDSSTISSDNSSTISTDEKSTESTNTESTVDSSPINSELNETQSLSLSSLNTEN